MKSKHSQRIQQRGVAILMAMLTVALVATIATSAVLQQWKAAEVEAAERDRVQAQWLLRGALDWSRLLLRQDSLGSANADHLSEPWALPLQETKLSAFITAQAGISDADASSDSADAYLSGGMQDQQAKLNLMNLIGDDAAHARHVQRLFERLGISQAEYVLLRSGLQRAARQDTEGNAPLMPQTLDDLRWLGLTPATIERLEPYATLLPDGTVVNINTASTMVVWAAAEPLEWGQASALIAAREKKYFQSLQEANEVLGTNALSSSYFAIRSSHFQATGRVRLETLALAMRAQVQRSGLNTTVLRAAAQGEVLTGPQPLAGVGRK